MLKFLLLLAAASGSGPPEPMLDGECSEYRPVRPLDLGHGVSLYLRQTRDHVWLCIAPPPQSFATVDVELQTPQFPNPINLHASAQLGEWDPRDPAAAPTTATSDLWWKIEGWTGTTNRFRPAGDGRGLEFFPVPGRELQISKSRFGRGEWRIKLKLAGLRESDVPAGKLSWPINGNAHRFEVR